jgi:hypothetical protein
LATILIFGLTIALVFGLFGGLLFGITVSISHSDIKNRTIPNQGIRQSARNALNSCVIIGIGFVMINVVILGPFFGLMESLIFGIIGGTIFGLVVGLRFGGYACWRHIVLRIILWFYGTMPLNVIPFLDYCAERIFLRKVGGGYIFVHRLLMEHFASLYAEKPTAEPVETQRTNS